MLIDTHALLWYLAGSDRLPPILRNAIAREPSLYAVSVAVLWEITVKVSLGKLTLDDPLDETFTRILPAEGFVIEPVVVADLLRVATLPLHHRDPFDRMLAAQALVRSVPVVSVDEVLDAYGVRRLWG